MKDLVDSSPKRRYHAFISYRHGPDTPLAEGVRTALHRLAKPWYRLRALSVFLDRESLGATPDLPSTISDALLQSEYLIVIASPRARESVWVGREASFWLQHKLADRILIVVAEGGLVWNDAAGAFVDDERNPLPPVLRHAFKSEPHFVDLAAFRTAREPTPRDPLFREEVATLAATLHGRSKDSLIGEDVRLFRQARRLATAAAVTLAILTVGASFAAYVAASNAGRALFAQGDALFRTARYEDARAAYESARRWLRWTWKPTMAVDAALAHQDLVAVPPLRVLDHHAPSDPVAAVSPDGRWLLVAGNEGVLKRADRDSGYAFRELGRHSDWITAIAISENSRAALTAGRDGFVKLWDLKQGTQKLALSAGRIPVWSVAFSQDGKTALSGGDDYKVRVWDLERGTLKATLAKGDHPHAQWIAALGFSGYDRNAFSASRDGAIKIWNPQDWSFVRAFGSAETLTSAAITPDGSRIVALDEEGHMHIWDTKSGEEVKNIAPVGSDLPRVIVLLPEYRLGISGAAFGGAGLALVGGGAGSLALWDIRNGERLQEFEGHKRAVRMLSLSDQDGRFVSASDDGTIRLWPTKPLPPQVTVDALRVHAVTLHPREPRIVASAGEEGQVLIWDAATLQPLRTLWGRGAPVAAMSFFPEGDTLVVSRRDGTVSIGSVTAEQPQQTIQADAPLVAVRTCPAAGTFVGVLRTGTVIRYAAGKASASFETGIREVRVHDVSSDCRRVAVGGYGDPVTVWDLARGARITTIGVAPFGFLTAAFMGDGDRLLLGTPDRTIELWKVSSPPRKIWASEQLPFQPSALTVATSGQLAFAGDLGGFVHVIDLRRGDVFRSYPAHDGPVFVVSVDARGEYGVSGGDDGTAHVWGFVPGAFAASGKQPGGQSGLYTMLVSKAKQRELAEQAKRNPDLDLASYWGLRMVGPELMSSLQEKIQDASAGVRQLGWTPEPYLDRAELRMQARDLVGAVSDYSAALALFPSDEAQLAAIYAARAQALQELGNNKRALRDYQRAVELNTSAPEPFNNRGNIYLARGDYDRAFAEYSRAISVAPALSYTWTARGVARLRNGDPQGALADMNRARQLAEQANDTWLVARAAHSVGLVHLVEGEIAAARQSFEESIRLSNATDSKIGRGVTYLLERRWKEAMSQFEEVGSFRGCGALLILARAQGSLPAAQAELARFTSSPVKAERALADKLAAGLGESHGGDTEGSTESCECLFLRGAIAAVGGQIEPALRDLRELERTRSRDTWDYIAGVGMLQTLKRGGVTNEHLPNSR